MFLRSLLTKDFYMSNNSFKNLRLISIKANIKNVFTDACEKIGFVQWLPYLNGCARHIRSREKEVLHARVLNDKWYIFAFFDKNVM